LSWDKVAVIVGVYVLGNFYLYLDAKFKAIEDRLSRLEQQRLVK
jgi:hypothetical protein